MKIKKLNKRTKINWETIWKRFDMWKEENEQIAPIAWISLKGKIQELVEKERRKK